MPQAASETTGMDPAAEYSGNSGPWPSDAGAAPVAAHPEGLPASGGHIADARVADGSCYADEPNLGAYEAEAYRVQQIKIQDLNRSLGAAKVRCLEVASLLEAVANDHDRVAERMRDWAKALARVNNW